MISLGLPPPCKHSLCVSVLFILFSATCKRFTPKANDNLCHVTRSIQWNTSLSASKSLPMERLVKFAVTPLPPYTSLNRWIGILPNKWLNLLTLDPDSLMALIQVVCCCNARHMTISAFRRYR